MLEKKEKLKLFLKETSKTIEPAIKELLNSYVSPKHKELVNYQCSTGGKRLRPSLAVISCRIFNKPIKNVLYPAAALEILHNYTLIVDDIIDNSELRRGRPTVWAKFGKSMAECIAIYYSAAVFQAANRSKNPEKISELLAKTLKVIVDGEILDILFEQAGREDEPFISAHRYRKITQKDYLEMAGKKTAVLFQSSCEIGGICAGAKKREIEALKNYGFNLGLAFQVQDDILDIFEERGQDIMERKEGNIVIIFALKELSENKKKKFLKIMRKKRINKGDIEQAMELIEETKGYQKACHFGQNFVDKAKNSLMSLPKNKWQEMLETAADFALKRKV